MQKFLKYFLIFIITYFTVNILIFLIMRSTYSRKSVNVNNEILRNAGAKIDIIDSRASTDNGFLVGKYTNTSNSAIVDKFLELSFFSKRGVNMGKKFVSISKLDPGESMNFRADYNYKFVDKIEANLIDKEALKEQVKETTNQDGTNNKFDFSAINKNIPNEIRNINGNVVKDWANGAVNHYKKLDIKDLNWDDIKNGDVFSYKLKFELFGKEYEYTPLSMFLYWAGGKYW